MTEQTHITQCDDPKYLPFARARIKAMRATGLQFLSQKFEVEGVQINVRIEGEHSFVSIQSSPGGYLCLPHSIEHPNGVTVDSRGRPVEPGAVVTQTEGGDPPVLKVRVRERKKVVTGLNDWRSNNAKNPRVITFSAASQRYFGYQPLRLANIYEKNKTIKTQALLPGKGTVNCGVLGAGVFSSGGKSFLMMATTGAQGGEPIGGGTTLFICYRARGEWKIAGTNALPANWDFTSLVIFSPGGTKFSAVVRKLDTTDIVAEKVSGTLSLSDAEEPVVVAAIIRTAIAGTEKVVTSFGPGPAHSGAVTTYKYPLAYDYTQDDSEVLVSLTTRISHEYWNITGYESAAVSHHTVIQFNNTDIYDILWYDYHSWMTHNGLYWVPNGTATQQKRAWLLALDARTNTCVVSTVAGILSWPYDDTRLWDWHVSLGISCLGRAKVQEWPLPPRLRMFDDATVDYRLHFRFFSHDVVGSYASRDGKTALVSASVDPILSSCDAPSTNSSIIWVTDGSDPRDKFTIGEELGFAINPITIF